MDERRPEPDEATPPVEEEGPPEIIEAALQELETPADESDEG
jgi:hypothetical protein